MGSVMLQSSAGKGVSGGCYMYGIHIHSTSSITHQPQPDRYGPACTPTAGLLGITFVLLSPLGSPSLGPEAALMVGLMRALLLVIAHPLTG